MTSTVRYPQQILKLSGTCTLAQETNYLPEGPARGVLVEFLMMVESLDTAAGVPTEGSTATNHKIQRI